MSERAQAAKELFVGDESLDELIERAMSEGRAFSMAYRPWHKHRFLAQVGPPLPYATAAHSTATGAFRAALNLAKRLEDEQQERLARA